MSTVNIGEEREVTTLQIELITWVHVLRPRARLWGFWCVISRVPKESSQDEELLQFLDAPPQRGHKLGLSQPYLLVVDNGVAVHITDRTSPPQQSLSDVLPQH